MKSTMMTTRWAAGLMGTTIFLSAFLLFGVQPLLGRYLLPWFGGMPEVWTTCMLFFQVFLLAGYAYAHALSGLKLVWQTLIHAALVLIAAATLSIIPDAAMKPTPDTAPVAAILWICTVCVGAAYFVLSATSPLIQHWFSQALPGRNPYRLYALSNAGSLLALASFPFVFEPLMTRNAMALSWEWGFWAYAGLIAVCGAVVGMAHPTACSAKRRLEAGDTTARPTMRDRFFWLALPMAASVELLAVTNRITLDIAVIPFLWVLPLGLYLLSFILCFDHPRWYYRHFFMALLIAGILGHIWVGRAAAEMHVGLIISIYATMLFACCMICHGELYRLRPDSRHLTGFYLAIAAGGALGGVFVAVVAPRIFNHYHELHIGLLATVLFVLLCQKDLSPALAKRRPWWAAALCIIGGFGIFLQGHRPPQNQQTLEDTRNFFGILSVLEEFPDDPTRHKRLMLHGTTYHGLQFQADDKRRLPTAYYAPDSGIGLLLRHGVTAAPRRIGIVGLGVGTIAAYGNAGDRIRFYEINPEVERMARQYFTYLADSPAAVEVVLGDARLSLEYEPPQHYDVLALDAFSSDAVPVHLLTVEAFAIYLSHLAEDGVLVVHLSTQHLDLQSVVWKLAEHFGLKSCWIEDYEDPQTGALASDWILLSRTESIFNLPIFTVRQSVPYADLPGVPLWTDDHINILKILKNKL